MTNADLQTILSSIWGVGTAVIVPKQGNWYNPQDRTTTPDTPATWVGYILRNVRPRVLPYYQPSSDDLDSYSTAIFIGTLELQIVGDAAETLAQSVAHWIHRGDVQAIFSNYQAQLMSDGLGRYSITPFDQEGLNTVWAYNIKLEIEFASTISTGQSIVESVTFNPEGGF